MEQNRDAMAANVFLFTAGTPSESDWVSCRDLLRSRDVTGIVKLFVIPEEDLVGLDADNYQAYLTGRISLDPAFSEILK